MGVAEGETGDVSRFLNRILGLKVHQQNLVRGHERQHGRQTSYNAMLTIATAIFRSLPTSARCSLLSLVLPRGKEGVSWQLRSLAKAEHPISEVYILGKEQREGEQSAWCLSCMRMHALAGSMKESQISWPSPS